MVYHHLAAITITISIAIMIILFSNPAFSKCQKPSLVAVRIHAHVCCMVMVMVMVLRIVDEMGGRIDELEKSIGNLMSQAGLEDAEERRVASTE